MYALFIILLSTRYYRKLATDTDPGYITAETIVAQNQP